MIVDHPVMVLQSRQSADLRWSVALSAAILLGLALIVRPAPVAAQAGATLTAAGQALYQARCSACHSIDADRIGPHHRGVVGRRAGSAVGFNYSPALKRFGRVWTPALLDRW